MDFLVAPSFQDGSGSAWACAEIGTQAARRAPAATAMAESRTRRLRSIEEHGVHGFHFNSSSCRWRIQFAMTARPNEPGSAFKAGRRRRGAVSLCITLASRAPGRLDLRFHGIEVEARALLHRRELDRGHRQLLDLLLDKHEAPELVLEPVEILLRPDLGPALRPSRALERIEAKVGQIGHVELGLCRPSQPPG